MSDPTANLRPQILNLELYRGDAWSVRLTARAPASAEETGDPLDLTDWDIAGRIAPLGETTLVDLDIAPTDLAGGVIHFGQDAAADAGTYDIQLTPPDGLPRTYLRGTIRVADDITP